jgi:translation initiation factor IF-1
VGDEERGHIEEVLPRGLYRVRLSSGRAVVAGMSAENHATVVRVVAGDEVIVRVSKTIPDRAQLVRKVKELGRP